MSPLLGTQELADLTLPKQPNLKDQILGNVTILLAHRQVILDSAEQIAAIAGARGTWVHTRRTEHRLNGQRSNGDTGTRTRGREFAYTPTRSRNSRQGGAWSRAPAAANPHRADAARRGGTVTATDHRLVEPRALPLDSALLKPDQAASSRADRLGSPRLGCRRRVPPSPPTAGTFGESPQHATPHSQ